MNCLSSDVASTYFWSAICIGIWSRSQEGLATKLKSTKRIFNYADEILNYTSRVLGELNAKEDKFNFRSIYSEMLENINQ